MARAAQAGPRACPHRLAPRRPRPQLQPPPQPSSETVLLNELVREYLIFNGLRDTLSVFLPGARQPARGAVACALAALDRRTSGECWPCIM